VQLYRSDAELIEPLAAFITDGIWQSERVIVIAAAAHRQALEAALRGRNVDVGSVSSNQQLQMFDAAECLGKFMVGDRPDANLFKQTVAEIVRHAAAGGRSVRAFGEMVALLWADGNRRAAMELEELWNDLSRECRFALFCAYPAHDVEKQDSGFSLQHICQSHAAVIPALT
jgi:hypothetical protein